MYVAQLSVPEYRWVDKGIFIAGLATGFFVLLEMAKIAWSAFFHGRETIGLERTDGQFLGLWYFGFFSYCLFFLTEGSARYILPLLPPFIICFFRLLELSEVVEYRVPRHLINSAMVASGSLVLSLVWGLALSRADHEFARIYPRAASEVARIVDSIQSYSSGEWGFRYYMNRAGLEPLPADTSRVRGGSFIAVPELAQPNDLPADLGSVTMPVQKIAYRLETPVRVLDWRTPAGFYSTGWGLIPFSFSREPLEEVKLLQVNFMAERLPWARVETVTGIQPWPGSVSLHGQSLLAVLAKAGTSFHYEWPFRGAIRLELQCGVSGDSYKDGGGEAFDFEIRQLGQDGGVLAAHRLTLRPGVVTKDRDWQPVRLQLGRNSGGVLEFRYTTTGDVRAGAGAFAQSVIWPEE